MPKILCLETSTRNCSVAIFSDDELLCLCEEQHENFRHDEWLHTFVEWTLEGAELELNQLDAVAVSSGPGSFTGLRIGVSAAKGFAFGLDIPLISITTLDILAEPHHQKEYATIIVALDARRMDVFVKTFHSSKQIEILHGFLTIDETIFSQLPKPVFVVGDATEKIKSFYPEFKYEFALPSAQYMGKIAAQKFQNKQFESVAYFEPNYHKEVFVTQPKNSLNAPK